MDALVSDIVLGIISVAIFQIRNPQKDFIHWVSLLLFLNIIAISSLMVVGLEPMMSMLISGSLAIGLALAYFLRFKKKDSLKAIDYIKWVGILLLMLPRVTFLIALGGNLDSITRILIMLTFPVLAIIYVYDRFVLNTRK